MTASISCILRRSVLVAAAAFALTPAAAFAEEGGEREGGILSGVLGQEERGFREEEGGEGYGERSGMFSRGEGGEEGEEYEERSGMFSRGEGGEEGEEGEGHRERPGMFSGGEGEGDGEERSRSGRFLGGAREGGEREMEEE